MQTLFIINSILRWTYFLYNWNSTNVDILQWTAINVRIFIFIEYTVFICSGCNCLWIHTYSFCIFKPRQTGSFKNWLQIELIKHVSCINAYVLTVFESRITRMDFFSVNFFRYISLLSFSQSVKSEMIFECNSHLI